MSGNSPINGEWRTDLLTPCAPSKYSAHTIILSSIMLDAPGAKEMSWLQVRPEELMEPKVTMVIIKLLLS